MEDITDFDHKHANNAFKKFKLKNFRRIPRSVRLK